MTGEFRADPEAAGYGDERAETLFRMAEEALRNVEKHSRATRVTLKLSMKADGDLILEVADDGIGFDVEASRPGHYGLVGLHEQAELIGARLLIDSRLGGGTRLLIALRTLPDL
jgi:signal transduction histidine kinase